MTPPKLPPLQEGMLVLLREVLEKQDPELIGVLLSRAASNDLSRRERAHLCELIAAEFADTGIGVDSEPTPRGAKLEALLDEINRPNIRS